MVSIAEIKKRLDKYNEVRDLPKKDKERFGRIMKNIAHTKQQNRNYLNYFKKYQISNTLRVSIPYLEACIQWLEEKGYLEKEEGTRRRKFLSLTDRGRKALSIIQDEFYTKEPELKLSLNLGGDEVTAKLGGETLRNIDKEAILSNSFIRNGILELSTALSLLGNLTLSIVVPRIANKRIYNLLKLLWSFYWHTIKGTWLNPLGPLHISPDLTREDDLEKYNNFWKKHLFIYAEGKYLTVLEYDDSSGERKVIEEHKEALVSLLPASLEGFMQVYIEDEDVRRWIEDRLEQNPDWFMPHHIWVKLGFKQRRTDDELRSVCNVSPPFFHNFVSPPLPTGFLELESIFRFIDDEKLFDFVISSVSQQDWKSQGFYESWRMLRTELEEKMGRNNRLNDVTDILDEALMEYRIGGKPNVDLKSALDDYRSSRNAEVIVRHIREGKYRLIENVA